MSLLCLSGAYFLSPSSSNKEQQSAWEGRKAGTQEGRKEGGKGRWKEGKRDQGGFQKGFE